MRPCDMKKPFVAVQFHPEVVHTLIGTDVLRNFIFGLCGCHPQWTMHSFIDATVRRYQGQSRRGKGHLRPVRRGRFLGGRRPGQQGHRRPVDLHLCEQRSDADRGIGKRPAFFPPENRPQVIDINATTSFLEQLHGIVRSRGKTQADRLRLHQRFSRRKPANWARSVIWPREPSIPMSSSRWFSGKAPIKSHHNVGGLPERMQLS
jgi:GMP synthase (glutamine-hydrolysing)